MIHINLLPHREMERVAQRRRFGFTIATSMATAIILTALIHVWLVTRLNNQLKRNNYLEQVNNQLNQQIGQIRKLKTERTKVLAREKIIGSLEEKRFQVVRMLNEIPRLIPDGVYLTSLKETNKDIALNGMASSNYSVADFMQNLSHSRFFSTPTLIQTKLAPGAGPRLISFSLTVKTHPDNTNKQGIQSK